MFENLSDRLSHTLRQVSGRGRLTEDNVKETLREVRMALLEADVALPVVKDFVARVKERAIGQDILQSLSPGQIFVKIVNDELVSVMGESNDELNLAAKPPVVILMAGLQGAGKTTTVAKLSKWLSERKKKSVMVASADVYRPAAIKQLETLAGEVGARFFPSSPDLDPVAIAQQAIVEAEKQLVDVVIIDTAGRLSIDEQMMDEIARLHAAVDPIETLFVVDSMTGQDAVNSGSTFNSKIGITGIILTKMDGDARGGAALSMRSVTGVPIKYITVGERPDQLEVYHPDRIASRILGMGDVESLIEKAETQFDTEQAVALENKIRKNQFDLDDMLEQFKTIKKMGSISDILGMMPGVGALKGKINSKDLDEGQISRVEAIIHSMTPNERREPTIINGSRRKRIAVGSGTSITQVNQLLSQFKQMQKMMKKLSGPGGKRALMGMMKR